MVSSVFHRVVCREGHSGNAEPEGPDGELCTDGGYVDYTGYG